VSRAFAGWWSTTATGAWCRPPSNRRWRPATARPAAPIIRTANTAISRPAKLRSATCWANSTGGFGSANPAKSATTSPRRQLSLELTPKEAVWSQAEYIEPETIQTAFQLDEPLPTRIGIGANQPSPYEAQRPKFRRLFWLFLGLLALGQLATLILSVDRKVHQQTFVFNADTKDKTLDSEPFALSGRPSNLVIKTQSNLNNNWIYLDLALIERDSGVSHAIGRELSYYAGVDDGERWSEGNASDEAVLPAIPAGLYSLSIEAELPPGAPTVTCTFTILRDVPSWANFFLALLGLLIVPIIFRWRAWAFERARWAESDYSTAGKDSDDDD